MLYRSTGKAKKGSCMFIIDKLYDKAINFLHMGIKIPEQNAPIVELGAYAPLISSGIVGNDFFLEYLKKNSNFSNDFEVLIALCEHNKEFYRSSYFRERKKKIIETYVLNVKTGKIIQNADNLTVVGSSFAMLLYAATGTEDSVDNDTTFYHEDGTIQCYTRRFNNNEHLAFFRSPFNSKNNLLYLHNHYDDRLEESVKSFL